MAIRFLLTIPALLAALTGLWVLSIPYVASPPFDAQWIEAIYRKKEAAARSAPAPRIVLVGGSSTHFSLSAQRMTEALGQPVINLATHAGLGIEYILYRAERSVRAGDTVILTLEYPMFQLLHPTFITSQYALFYDRRYMLHTNPVDALQVAFGTGPVGLLRHHVYYLGPWASPAPLADKLSPAGDEWRNTLDAVTDAMRAAVRNSPPASSRAFDVNKASSQVRKFAEWARENHIHVLHTWPALYWRPDYDTPPYQRLFKDIGVAYERNGIPAISDPQDFALRFEEMFDSIGHANSVGRTRLTDRFLILICARSATEPGLIKNPSSCAARS